VSFSNKTKHIIHYNSDVEIFIREKEKKDGRNIQAKSDEKTT